MTCPALSPATRNEALHYACDVLLGLCCRISSRGCWWLRSLWTKVLEIAESLDDGEYQLRSLWGLSIFHLQIGELQVALAMAQRFRTLAAEKQPKSVSGRDWAALTNRNRCSGSACIFNLASVASRTLISFSVAFALAC